jgi:hypothetical protein
MPNRASQQAHGDKAHPQADAAECERRVPAQFPGVVGVNVVLDGRRGQHRDRRADVDGHVVDGEGAVDLRVVALVDLAHQVGGIGLEQAIADDDHAQCRKRQPGIGRRDAHQRVAERQDDGADHHRAARAEHLVADPAADRRRDVDQRGGCAPYERGAGVVEPQALHHEVDDQRLHAVVAEALPQLDQRDRGE